MQGRSVSAAFVAFGLILAGLPAQAGPEAAGASPPGGFTFHMVKPPKPGTKRFITVQINPAVQQRWIENAPAVNEHNTPDPARTPVTQADPPQTAGASDAGPKMTAAVPAPRRAARYSWYWQAISPALGARAGRFQAALAELSMGPGGKRVHAPRLQAMQALARTWGTDILKATVGTQVSPALVLAVMSTESGGRADAVSSAGARGLMQLIPATAGRFGVDASDPKQNIQGAVAYLDWLMGEFKGDPLMVLAAYNAGENAVKAAGGVPDYAETRDYVPKVLAAWQVAQGLCVSRPQLISDGCVFKVLGKPTVTAAKAAADG